MSDPISVTPANVETVLSDLPRLARLAFGFGSRLRRGTLDVTLPDGRTLRLGGHEPGPSAAMRLHNYGFASRLLNGGDIGIAEAYLADDWDTPDLTQFLYLFCVNHDLIQAMLDDKPLMRFVQLLRHWFNRNTEAAGPPQHLRPLRSRQCVLLGLARPEHDLFLGAVRGRHATIWPPRRPANIAGSAEGIELEPAKACWKSAAAGAALPNSPPRSAPR